MRDWDDIPGREKTISGTSKSTPLKKLTFTKQTPEGTKLEKKVLDYLKECKLYL
jgi:hypothetical protein